MSNAATQRIPTFSISADVAYGVVAAFRTLAPVAPVSTPTVRRDAQFRSQDVTQLLPVIA